MNNPQPQLNKEKKVKQVFTLEMPPAMHRELSEFVESRKDRYSSMAQVARIAINEFLGRFNEK